METALLDIPLTQVFAVRLAATFANSAARRLSQPVLIYLFVERTGTGDEDESATGRVGTQARLAWTWRHWFFVRQPTALDPGAATGTTGGLRTAPPPRPGGFGARFEGGDGRAVVNVAVVVE